MYATKKDYYPEKSSGLLHVTFILYSLFGEKLPSTESRKKIICKEQQSAFKESKFMCSLIQNWKKKFLMQLNNF